eukprot:4093050-Prymnesium_polylepis.2
MSGYTVRVDVRCVVCVYGCMVGVRLGYRSVTCEVGGWYEACRILGVRGTAIFGAQTVRATLRALVSRPLR